MDSNKTVFFVNPMGRGTLKLYDVSLLANLKNNTVFYMTSVEEKNDISHIRTYNIYNYFKKPFILKPVNYLFNHWALHKLIKKEKPKLIHFQWLKIPHIDYLFLKILRKNNIKTVLTAHNVLPHNSGNKYKSIFLKIYKLLDQIIVHTQVSKEELIRDFRVAESKIKIVPHGLLDVSNKNEKETKNIQEELFSRYKLAGKTVFAMLGNLTKYKGIELLTEAWQEFGLGEKSNCHLIIAGKGDEKLLAGFKKFSNVTIQNQSVPDTEFTAIMRVSDYILLPYLKISQSGLLLTALKEKKKVIVSNKGGLTEPFQFGNIGYVLDRTDAKCLAETLLVAQENKNLAPTTDTWNQIHNYYDWEEIGKKTTLLYNEIIKI